MIFNVYAIFDSKGKFYGNPFYRGHNGEALRQFSDMVQDSGSIYSKHPEDYSLYRLGTFDTNEGSLGGLKNSEFLANAIDFVAK